MSQEAVELAPLWIQHDSDMSFPNHQITGLRFFNSSEILGSAIQVGRTRIWIGEPRPVIYRVHQMRAVANATDPGAPVEGDCDHLQTIISRQSLSRMFPVHLHTANRASASGILGQPRRRQ